MTHLSPEQIESLAREGKASASDAHLTSCSECTQAVRDARGRQRLFAGMKRQTLSDMGFRRVEARLNEHIDAGADAWNGERSSLTWLWLGLAGAAAVIVAFMLLQPKAQEATDAASAIAKVTPLKRAPVRAAFQPMTVALASTDAKMRPGHDAWKALAVGEVLRENVAVSATRVVLAVNEGTWVFDGRGSLALGGGAATVSLGAGSLVAQVRGSQAIIAAGAHSFTMTDAVVAFSRAASEVVFDVIEGSVAVTDASMSSERTFKAPAHVRLVDDVEVTSALVDEKVGFVERAKLSPQPWQRLDVGDLLAGAQISIDGQEVGVAPFSMLLSSGKHLVRSTLPGKATTESWVDLTRGAGSFPPVASAPHDANEVEPDADALQAVLDDVKRQTPLLRSCYEKWLKANPTAGGTVTLVLSVNAKGRVTNASVKGEAIAKGPADCLKITAKRLVLSPLGSQQDLEIPLVMTTKK